MICCWILERQGEDRLSTQTELVIELFLLVVSFLLCTITRAIYYTSGVPEAVVKKKVHIVVLETG